MSTLDYYRVGRTILWRGAPLRVVVGLDRERAADESLASQVRFELRSEGDAVHALESTAIGVTAVAEYDTAQLSPGAAELRFEVPSPEADEPAEVVVMPEEIWILEREDYEAFLNEELEEKFEPSAELTGEEVVELVRRIARDRVEGFLPVRAESVGSAGIAAAPVQWATEKVLDLAVDVGAGGVTADSALSVSVDSDARSVMFQLRLFLLTPMSEPLVWSLDDSLGHLEVLRTVAEISNPVYEVGGTELSVDVGLGGPELRGEPSRVPVPVS
jgi:hypothetical protein